MYYALKESGDGRPAINELKSKFMTSAKWAYKQRAIRVPDTVNVLYETVKTTLKIPPPVRGYTCVR